MLKYENSIIGAVGRNMQYYENAVREIDAKGFLFPVWNWSAFFFNFGWMIYRKLGFFYLGLHAATLGILGGLIYELFQNNYLKCILLFVLYVVAYGMYGTNLYIYSISRYIDDKSLKSNEQEYARRLKGRFGTIIDDFQRDKQRVMPK